MRDSIFYKNLLDISNIGYIYCKILYNDGILIDYTVIESNLFFEKHFFNQNKIDQVMLMSEYSKLVYDFKNSVLSQNDSRTLIHSKYTNDLYEINLTNLDKDSIVIHGKAVENPEQILLNETNLHQSITKNINKEEFIHAILLGTNELLTNMNFNNSVIKSLSIVGNAIQVDRIFKFLISTSDKLIEVPI